MTPEALCGPKGRRSCDLKKPHDAAETARRTSGLEPAVVDNAVHMVGALDNEDMRSFEIKVAGPAALVVSKVIKIAERRGDPRRLKAKDGLDVLRLLRAEDPARLAGTLRDLASDTLAGPIVGVAVENLRELAAGPEAVLPDLAADAEAGFGDLDEIKLSMVALVDELMEDLGR